MKLVFPKPTGAQPRFPDQAQVDVSALLYLPPPPDPPCVLHAPHIGAPPSTRWSTSSRASPRHAPASCHRHLCRRCLGLFQSCDDKSSKNYLLSKVEDMESSLSPMITFAGHANGVLPRPVHPG